MKSNRLFTLPVSIISACLLISILTIAPTTVMGDLDRNDIQAIAAVSATTKTSAEQPPVSVEPATNSGNDKNSTSSPGNAAPPTKSVPAKINSTSAATPAKISESLSCYFITAGEYYQGQQYQGDSQSLLTFHFESKQAGLHYTERGFYE